WRCVCYGEDGDQLRDVTARDVVLGSVENEAVAVANSPGLDGLGIGAGIGLGEGEGGDPFARGELGEPALLLGVAAAEHEAEDADAVVARDEHVEGGVGATELLLD